MPVSREQDELLYYKNSLPYSRTQNKTQLRYVRDPFDFSNCHSKRRKRRATLFWVHGGGNVAGLANDPTFDGTVLASSENVLVVSANYRLGAFGWLYLNDGIKGNMGLYDTLLAIEWYRTQYLKFFGGATNQLCLFGESAGAMNIHALIMRKRNSNKDLLFNRVIMQSGQHNISWTNANDMLKNSIEYLKLTKCWSSSSSMLLTNDTWNCLLNASASYLNEIPVQTPFVKDFWNPTSDFIDM